MSKSIIIRIAFSLCATLLFGNLSGQAITFPQVQGFKIVSEYPVYTPGDLWDYINGAADAYLSYGFSELHIAEYVKGKNRIKVEIYDHVKPILGFGIYSLERSPGYNFTNIGSQGYAEVGLIHFFKGQYYVKVVTNSSSKGIAKSLNDIARSVAASITGPEEMPSIFKRLPVSGRISNEELYINESVLGHSFLNGAMKAVYEVEGSRFNLYLFEMESEAKAYESVAAYLKIAEIEPENETDGKYQFKDGYNGLVYLVWNRNTFAVITGLDSGMESFAGTFCDPIVSGR